MKIQLSTETQLLINRHLDSLVMSAIYGVCKVQPQMNVTFNNIINIVHLPASYALYLKVMISDS